MLRCLALCCVFATCFSLRTSEDTSGEWYDWCTRVPRLTSACISGDFIQVWSAMGSRAWMQFVDWTAQPYGVHVYDFKNRSFTMGQDGNYSGHVLDEYDRWRKPSTWTHRWTASRFQTLAENLMGSHVPWFTNDTQTSHRCHHHLNKHNCKRLALELNEPNLFFIGSWQSRLKESDRLFREYYEEVDALKKTWISQKPLPLIFEPLMRLYAKQALLHPARNANSRSRLFLLQTELVRNGGHPVMLEDIDQLVYSVHSMAELKRRIVDAWCAWEWAFETGASIAQVSVPHGTSFIDGPKLRCGRPSLTDTPVLAAIPSHNSFLLKDSSYDSSYMEDSQEVSAEELDRLRMENDQ